VLPLFSKPLFKLGGGGGSTKTIITSSGQAVATRASITTQAVVPEPVGGGFSSPFSTRPVSLPFPTPRPTMLGGQSLFGGRFKLPQPSGLVQPYRPAITPFSGGGGSTQVVKPLFESLPPIANIGGVPVVTQETVKTSQSSGSSSSSSGEPNTALWQGGLLLGPLVLGWLFGTKTIRHRRHRGLRHRLRRLRRPSFRRIRHRSHRR